MEFDEMKTIWDAQNNQTLYAIDEKALHTRVLSKKSRSRRNANFTELLLIIVNIAVACFITAVNLFRSKQTNFIFVMAGWMLLTAGFVLVARMRRTRNQNRFDRSVLGDLKD